MTNTTEDNHNDTAPASDYQLLASDDDGSGTTGSDGFDVVPVPPPATATVVVEVVAPANLPENYQFSAETADGQTVTVTVPQGGVVQGDLIAVNLPTARVTDAVAVQAEAIDDVEDEEQRALVGDATGDIIPTRAWRDGLCGCCNHGCCHPHLCLSLCGFTPILLAQVMYRMRLNWFGSGPTNSDFQRNLAFYVVTLLFWSLFLLPTVWAIWGAKGLVMCVGHHEVDDYDDDTDHYCASASTSSSVTGVVSTAIGLYFFFLTCRTRRAIRRRYHIPETSCCCCRGCEDCCCAYWCGALSVMQMARHTAEYETYAASCCSRTGVAERHPPIVV